jgi:hypothetical protein
VGEELPRRLFKEPERDAMLAIETETGFSPTPAFRESSPRSLAFIMELCQSAASSYEEAIMEQHRIEFGNIWTQPCVLASSRLLDALR